MARYDYTCAACGRRFEVVHGIHEDGPTACPLCGSGPIRKAFAAPTIHFKGTGWAKKERRATRSPSPATSDDGSTVEPAASASGGDTSASTDAKPAKTVTTSGDPAPAAGPSGSD
jgi:putative FmdB family regulatory protein